MASDTPEKPKESSCPRCQNDFLNCVCAEASQFPTRTRVLILQHPQEARNPLGTARLTHLALPNSILRVGLSWPSLSAAVKEKVMPSKWAVLFLGSLKESKGVTENVPLQIRTKAGKKVPLSEIEGIVLLDGNWKQSKTLWWRNAWMLKLNRILLNPGILSQYGSLRRQPRKNCLSTIEAAAETLGALGEDPGVAIGLHGLFARFLEKAKQAPPAQ